MSKQNKTLYERLGGYDAIAAVANNLVARLNKDPQLGASGRIAVKTGSSARSNF
jgi:truncated hemoglobin YjbI